MNKTVWTEMNKVRGKRKSLIKKGHTIKYYWKNS